ncbi:hypothetical protein [uncultured Marinobacter sp.]|jgi:hypothetical protein|uniref:hypothetical protein n=1 Tax=uncultured Marinobacter sp. TaxID=187379 RepID=UPI00259212D5|nr:hypothetical protein [uncultured Marinobacter sp.]
MNKNKTRYQRASVAECSGGEGGYGGEDFLVSVSATVTIPPGEWTMWVASDDGRILNMPGIEFYAVSNQSNLHDGGDGTAIIGHEYQTPHMYSRGTFSVTAETTVNLYAMLWEHLYGDSFELAVKGSAGSYKILKDGLHGWAVHSDQP